MTLRQLLFLLAGVVLLGATPAGAIETQSFGFDIVDGSDDQRLHIAIRAGETTDGRLRVWNKSDRELTLRFQVVPASVDSSGTASLEGDDEPVGWVSVSPSQVELEPGAEHTVSVEVSAPRKLDGETKTVAVMAEPAATEGADAPAVLQRLAITTFLEPDEDSLIASLGPFPWIAAGVLLVVLALLGRRVLIRRNADSSERPAPS